MELLHSLYGEVIENVVVTLIIILISNIDIRERICGFIIKGVLILLFLGLCLFVNTQFGLLDNIHIGVIGGLLFELIKNICSNLFPVVRNILEEIRDTLTVPPSLIDLFEWLRSLLLAFFMYLPRIFGVLLFIGGIYSIILSGFDSRDLYLIIPGVLLCVFNWWAVIVIAFLYGSVIGCDRCMGAIS